MKNYYVYFFVFVLMISCSKKEEKKDPVNVTGPIVEETIKEPINDIEQVPELIFTVQIAALRNKNSRLADIQNIQISKEEGLIKYRLGKLATYKEAWQIRTALLNKYPDAFVQALKNGKRIHIKEALEN